MKKHHKTITTLIVAILLLLILVISGCSASGTYTKPTSSKSSETISEILQSQDFKSLSEEEQVSIVSEKLHELADSGDIKEDSIQYDEREKLFTYENTDGTLGGVMLREFDEKLNFHSTSTSTVAIDEENPELYETSADSLNAIVLNGFEDTSYRRDYYTSLESDWDSNGLETSVDTSVTVSEMKKLAQFDVVVFAMHGNHYNDIPALCINQSVTAKSEKELANDKKSQLIAKVQYQDGSEGYWILPQFFTTYYTKDELKAKIIFSESCMFYGCDHISTKPNYDMANSIDEISTGAIIGYHNSVGADYSRDVMKYTIDNMLEGQNASTALDHAKNEYGENDNWEDVKDDKYIAYPIVRGNSKSTLVATPVSDFSIQKDLILTIGEVNVIEPKIKPDYASEYTIKWTSSDESVVTVSPTGENGIVTAKNKGSATITAELNSGGKIISKTTNVRVASKGRDTVLVLDISGSMSGEPLEEMKKSAVSFCDELLTDEYNNRVGIVFYNSYIDTIDLTNDLDTLTDYIDSAYATSTTNMEGALSAASEMLDNEGKQDSIKNIVIMADGLPNEGTTSSSGSMPDTGYYSYNSGPEYASAVIDTAKTVRSKYNLYSLGFFHSLYDDEKDFAVTLMKSLVADEKDYYQVDEAENLQFVFGDIQETISDGSKIIVNIACPVDISVTYNGETLSSATDGYCDTTSFGTLQLLGSDNDIKVLSLDPDIEYDIEMIGTDSGTMDYSVNYVDEDENIIDYRSFESIPLTNTTVIHSNTNNSADVTLNVDADGDGEIDLIWSASPSSTATLTFGNEEPEEIPEPEPEYENSEDDSWKIILIITIIVFILVAVIVAVVFLVSTGNKKNKKIEIPIVNSPPQNEGNDKINDDTGDHSLSKFAVVIISGSMAGTRFELNDKETFTVGKGNNPSYISLSADYTNVSRKHCTITCDTQENYYCVTDCSMNGTTFKNGKKLVKNAPTRVEHGNTLILANNECEILFE